jgi:hypothetical protein
MQHAAARAVALYSYNIIALAPVAEKQAQIFLGEVGAGCKTLQLQLQL